MTDKNKIKKRLQLGKQKLNILLEITKGINNNLSKEKLLKIYQNVLVKELNIGKVLLYSKSNESWKEELCLGTSCSIINVQKDLSNIKQITVLNNSDNKKLDEFDVIVPVFHKSQPLAYLLLGDFAGEKIEVSPIIKHLTFIQTLTNVIIVAIENKRLYKENIQQIAIQKEMQSMLFPETLPNNDKIEAGAKYLPHHLIGGDFYDLITLNSNEIAFCIADVSGKGVPAALLMSNFQASLHALISRTSSLTELVMELNKNILANAKREKFITAFIGKYNFKSKNLQYINAGHNPPLLLIKNEFKLLRFGCTVLGMFDNLPTITEKTIKIPQDALLISYTDGVTEQTNLKNKEFGNNNLEKSILKNKDNTVKNIISNIVNDINLFKNKREYSDDIAILGIRFN